MLLAFSDNKLIANSGINLKEKTQKHIGILGISVIKNFRGEGIGRLLMRLVLKEVEKELTDLKIVTLEVYSTNSIAQNLYQKMGFIHYGKLPNGIMRAGIFEDAILMYKNISS